MILKINKTKHNRQFPLRLSKKKKKNPERSQIISITIGIGKVTHTIVKKLKE